MDRSKIFLVSTFISLTCVSLEALATLDTAEPNAQVVHLRANKLDGTSGCYETGTLNELGNCFTNLTSLKNWITDIRKPTAAAPLLVDVGPGKFGSLTLNCNNTFGYITFQGSGRKNTVIGGLGASGVVGVSIRLTNCTAMIFQDLTVGPMQAYSFDGSGGIRWSGIGTSVWQNVDVFADQGIGWQNSTSCDATLRGAHYWFGSRIVVTNNTGFSTAYTAKCAEEWLFGSELTINVNNSVSGGAQALRAVGSNTEVHFLSGAIRTIAAAGVTAPPFSLNTSSTSTASGLASVLAQGGKIFISGTGIDVLNIQPNAAGVLAVNNGGEIHANSAAYNLSTGAGGTVTRILNAGGTVNAAYQWEPHPEVPLKSTGATLLSITGADTAVVTNTTDSRPHLVIYDSTCASKWFDLVTNGCR